MSILKVITKYAPEILTALGVGLMAASTISAVKSTPKAYQALKDEEKKHKEPLKVKDKVKTCGKYYIPAITLGVAGAGCIFGSSAYNIKVKKDAAVCLSTTTEAFSAYRKHIINKNDKGAELDKEAIKKAVSSVKDDTKIAPEAVLKNGENFEWIVEPVTGDTWVGSRNDTDSALNKFNSKMMVEMYESLNEWLYLNDRKPTELDVGWRVGDGLLDISYELTTNKHGYAAWKMVYSRKPSEGYWKESY